MATFGQGINPQLGAIDYSPILKGSVAGAEMAAKGGQMIGQGLANLGEEVGKGVAAYYKKKEIKKLEDDGVAFVQKLGTTSPYLLKSVGITDVNDVGAIKAGMKAVGGAANFLNIAQGLKGELDQQGGTALGNLYNRAGNTNLSPIDKQFNPIEYSPESQKIARSQFMQDQLAQATIKKIESEAKLAEANAGTKVSLAGFGTLKEAQDSVTGKEKDYTFHFIGNRYVVLPIDAKTSLEVGALEANATAVEAGKTAESALKAANGTPETHRVEWTGKNFTATPFNKTELLEIQSKQGILNEKDKKTLFERRQYSNKIDNELYSAGVMKEQLVSVAGKASSVNPGFWTNILSNVPGTEQYDFKAQIDTIMSKIGFDRLRQMRDSSPNGSSGLGALNVKEFDALQNSLANLKVSQSYPQFLDNLNIVQKNYDRVIASLEQDKKDFSSSVSSAGGSNGAVPLSEAAQQYLPR